MADCLTPFAAGLVAFLALDLAWGCLLSAATATVMAWVSGAR